MSPIRIALLTAVLTAIATTSLAATPGVTTARRLTNQAIRNYLPFGRRGLVRTTARNLREAAKATNCNPNVCFALQGDDTLSEEIFAMQKFLAISTASILSITPGAHFSAVQFSNLASAITPFEPDVGTFAYAVGNSTFDGRRGSNLAAGLAYCGFQLAGADRPDQSVVLLGSAASTTGLAPAQIVARIIPPEGNGQIFGVSTAGDVRNFINAVGPKASGDNLDRVFPMQNSAEVSTALQGLVQRICGFEVCGGEPCVPDVVENSEA